MLCFYLGEGAPRGEVIDPYGYDLRVDDVRKANEGARGLPYDSRKIET